MQREGKNSCKFFYAIGEVYGQGFDDYVRLCNLLDFSLLNIKSQLVEL